VLEGVLIVIASAAIIIRVIQDRRSPMPLESLGIGLVVSGAATVMNLLYGMYMLRVGRRLHSPALVADGKHLMSDVVTSVGVLTGLGLVALTGWRLFDPILALGVACYILFVGWRLVHSSLSSLLDEAAPAEVQNRIRALVKAHAEGAIEAHDFRTRNSGRLTFIEFHLIVPSRTTVEAAHVICDRLEKIIERDLPGSEVTIHVEPASKAKHQGVVLDPSNERGSGTRSP
jgi:cation diffusion facilitator family transporter